MALFNFKAKKENKAVNLAGGDAYVQTPETALASLLLTSFVKDQFYRDTNQAKADLAALMAKVDPLFAAKAGIYARNVYGMRSITHVLAVELAAAASGKTWAKAFYESIIRRPDDMLEIAALYRSLGGKNLPNAMKKGFAAAFDRFDGYQLAKYRGEDKAFKLVDLVNLVHPVASGNNGEALRLLVEGKLKNKDTWEAKLSEAGQVAASDAEKSEMKATAWGELISSGKLGYLALLRNIRNIAEQAPELEADVVKALTNRERIKKSLVMPFQILVAMEALEASSVVEKRKLLNALTDAIDISLDNVPRFEGKDAGRTG
jgi:60 kDa SS-A/Ro ribonucleoprotein